MTVLEEKGLRIALRLPASPAGGRSGVIGRNMPLALHKPVHSLARSIDTSAAISMRGPDPSRVHADPEPTRTDERTGAPQAEQQR